MFQNHFPGNFNYEAVVPLHDSLRHIWFSYGGRVWNVGRRVRANIGRPPAFFQNIAPGNFNYELIVNQDQALMHYWFSLLEQRWHEGDQFGSRVSSPAAVVQVDSKDDHNFHLAVQEGERIRHHIFRYGGSGWEEGQAIGTEVGAAPSLVQDRSNDDLFLVAVEGRHLSGYRYRREQGDWQPAAKTEASVLIDSAPLLFQNRAPGNANFELIVREEDRLRHYWYDVQEDVWRRGESFGTTVTSEPFAFQNHAPFNYNFELVVAEGGQLQHYYFDLLMRRWQAAGRFGAGVGQIYGFIQNRAPGNFNYELLAEEEGALRHYWFSVPDLQWRKGLSPSLHRLRMTAPSEAVFVSAYAPMGLEVDPALDLADLEFFVDSPSRFGSYVSLATHPHTKEPELLFLAGSQPGRYDIVARRKSDGKSLDQVTVEVTSDWPEASRDGPPFWIGTHQEKSMGGALWGSPNDEPTMTGDVKPVSGNLRAVVLLVDTSDQRYSQSEAQSGTTRWTDACNSSADWSAATYWPEVSYGKIPTFQASAVIGPVNLPQGWKTYFHDNYDDKKKWTGSGHKGNLLQSAVTATQKQIDFDNVDIVVCASRNPDATRFTWPKAEADRPIQYTNGQGKTKNKNVGLVSMPFNWGQTAATAQARHRTLASTLCHELGHTLRLGDVYNWGGHPQHIQDRQLGRWDLMANQSNLPQLVATWRQQLGWVDANQEVRRFNFAKLGNTDEVVDLYPLEQANLPQGGYKAIEVLVADGWSLFFEYRLAQPGQIGDQSLPAPGAVLVTDVVRIKDWDHAQRRKPILLGRKDDEGDGPSLAKGQEWRVIDPAYLPAEFAAKVLDTTTQKAQVRITYGENSRPDPALLPWNTSYWQSPSIEVRNARTQADPKWRNTPLLGAKNTLVAKVLNASKVAAPGVAVRFWVKDFNVGGGAQRFIQRVVADVPAKGSKEFEAKDAWVPGKEGHYCIVAEIDPYYVPGTNPPVLESSGLNNRAQSNYDRFISKSSSPVSRERVTVTVENPFDEATAVTLHAVQSSPLYRTFVSARSLNLGRRESRRIEVLAEYGTDETDSSLTEDDREAYLGLPNQVSLWATAREPDKEEEPVVLLGGAALQVVTGRATRFTVLAQGESGVAGQVVASDDGRPVPGGFALVTAVSASGRLRTFSGPVAPDGRFDVQLPPGSVRAWADYVPVDGFGECTHPEIPLPGT